MGTPSAPTSFSPSDLVQYLNDPMLDGNNAGNRGPQVALSSGRRIVVASPGKSGAGTIAVPKPPGAQA